VPQYESEEAQQDRIRAGVAVGLAATHERANTEEVRLRREKDEVEESGFREMFLRLSDVTAYDTMEDNRASARQGFRFTGENSENSEAFDEGAGRSFPNYEGNSSGAYYELGGKRKGNIALKRSGGRALPPAGSNVCNPLNLMQFIESFPSPTLAQDYFANQRHEALELDEKTRMVLGAVYTMQHFEVVEKEELALLLPVSLLVDKLSVSMNLFTVSTHVSFNIAAVIRIGPVWMKLYQSFMVLYRVLPSPQEELLMRIKALEHTVQDLVVSVQRIRVQLQLPMKRHCSALGCYNTAALKACSRCNTSSYCGKQCQLAHWKAHKAECKQATGSGNSNA
jgi:hypothetical protein